MGGGGELEEQNELENLKGFRFAHLLCNPILIANINHCNDLKNIINEISNMPFDDI